MYIHYIKYKLESVQYLLIKLDIKPPLNASSSTFSLNNVIVRLTKIMNRAKKNWAYFLYLNKLQPILETEK